MCADVIPYTRYPNRRLQLYEREDYEGLLTKIHESAANCSDAETIRWGVCHSVFPRCLMGFEMYLCQDICVGTLRQLFRGYRRRVS
jgi:hypothetical protein